MQVKAGNTAVEADQRSDRERVKEEAYGIVLGGWWWCGVLCCVVWCVDWVLCGVVCCV